MGSIHFEVQLTRQAEKDLDSLRSAAPRAVDAMLALEESPRKGHALAGSLKGARALEFSLPGSGVYRAVYVVLEAQKVCLVFLIGPHENIYAKAERRLRALRRGGSLPR